MSLVLVINQEGQRSMSTPNNACTRQVGLCAFSSVLRGLKLVPINGVVSSRPQRLTPTVGRLHRVNKGFHDG